MNNSTYRFTLDLQKHNSQVSIAVYKYDSAVSLLIGLTDGGKPYKIEEGCYAIFYGMRANGKPLIHKCEFKDNTEITYEFKNATADCVGIVNCQIRLYSADKKLITAPRFTIIVEERVVSEDDIEVIDDSLEGIDQIFTEEKARIEAEEDRVEAEWARVVAEDARVVAETARVDAEVLRESAEWLRDKAEVDRDLAEKYRASADLERKSVWVAYSTNPNGSDYTWTWSEGQNYIGVAVSHDAPSNEQDFVWSLFKGVPGEKGEKGDDGYTPEISLVSIGGVSEIRVKDKDGTVYVTQVKDGKQGEKGEKGDPFSIAKMYTSIAEMNSDFGNTSVRSGSFVMIDTGNPEDEDNGKVFVKGATAFAFVVDMSGVAGLKGEPGDKGEKGDPGTSISISRISESDADSGSNVVTFTDGKTLTIKNGSKGSDGAKGDPGDQGIQGEKGDPGTSVSVSSVSESKVDSGSNVVTFSNGQTLTIKNGSKGSDGADGSDYVLTSSDKAEIAGMVNGATVVQAPKYVNSVEEMTDTSRVYVLASTGKIWAYMNTAREEEKIGTDTANTIFVDSNFLDGQRLSSDATQDTFGTASGYHLTPKMDLSKYAGKTIQIHLDSKGSGVQYGSTGNYANYIQCRAYDANGDILSVGIRSYVCDTAISNSVLTSFNNVTIKYNSANSTTMTINMPLTAKGATSTEVRYLRFCGKGAIGDSNIYITYPYTEIVTGGAWVDTHTSYSPSISNEDMNTIAEQAAAIVDTELLSVIGSGEVSI